VVVVVVVVVVVIVVVERCKDNDTKTNLAHAAQKVQWSRMNE
jgi:hypothetical protein